MNTKRKIFILSAQLIALLSFILAFILYILYVFNPPQQTTGNIIFLLISYLIIYLPCLILIIKCTKNTKIKIIAICILTISLLLRLSGSDFQSFDYSFYLHNWIEDYKTKSLKNCFISTISNYTPPYNYFLILFSRLPIYDLYLLKILSTIFEALSAIMITLIIAKISNKKFNVLILAMMLLLPTSLGNSSWWAQCDTIYTFWGLLGLYLALKHKSKLSFLCFGISSAFKMQSIILYPAILLLLLFKDKETNTTYLKWKDIYLFAISLLPLIFFPVLIGRPFKEIITIYLSQTEENARLSGNCPNFNIWIRILVGNNKATTLITIITTLITVLCLVTILTFAIKKYQKTKFLPKSEIPLLCLMITFIIIYFMTRMNDRFFMYSAIFSFISLCMYNDNILRLGNLTNITALLLVMLTDRFYILCVLGAAFNIVTFVCYTISFYKYFIKKHNTELQNFQTIDQEKTAD